MPELQLIKELSDYELISFESFRNTYIYNVATPVSSFDNVISLLDTGDYCVVTTARNSFDKNLACSMLQFVLQRQSLLVTATPLMRFDGFSCGGFSFDAVTIMSPRLADRYKNENRLLNERAFVYFPAYRCEMSTNETMESARTISRDFLDYADWQRKPTPKIVVRPYSIASGKIVYRKNSGLSELNNMIWTIEEICQKNAHGIEVENYLQQVCRVTKLGSDYLINFENRSYSASSTADLAIELHDFLVNSK